MDRRICVVGPSKHFFSGLTAHTIFLANALNKDGQTSVLLLRRLLPRFLYPGKEHVGKDNYLVDFTEGTPTYDGMDWSSPLSWIRAYRFLKQHRPDAIIMLWWTSSVAHMQLLLALANKARIGAKLILEMHEVVDPLEERILPIRLYSRAAGRLLTRSADAFIVHSTWARTQVAKIYHIPEDGIFVKPIGLYKDYERKYDKDVAKNNGFQFEPGARFCPGGDGEESDSP